MASLMPSAMQRLRVKAIAKQKQPPSTQTTVKFIVILAQCFTLLPIDGVTSTTPADLKFTWKSWKIFYTILTFFSTFFVILMGMVHFFLGILKFERIGKFAAEFSWTEGNFEIFAAVEHIFYLSAITKIVLFLRLARIWPKLIMEWTKIDAAMEKNYGYPKKLDRKLKWTCFFVIITATGRLRV